MSLRVPEFTNVRIAVAGDVMLDHYLYGDTSRISPEAPVPVVLVRDTERRAGGAANVACNAARLGAVTALAGIVGEDADASALAGELARAGVENVLRAMPDFATITKTRIISRHQQLLRLDHETRVPAAGADALQAAAGELARRSDALILSDYGKGTLREVDAIIEVARRHRVPVLVDPKGRDFERYRGATVLTPNQSEFEAVAGPCATDADFARQGRALRERLQIDAVLITRGENGMTLVPPAGEALHLKTSAREVFDVTGAGDTVIAALACSLAAGSTLQDAARIANLAAGLAVSRLGAATVSRAELIAALESAAHVTSSQLDVDGLLQAVALARARGEQIVMTNGCFDLLHAGHVRYLSEAARLGDRLVVAVNSDASVARLKGPGRPLNPAPARAAVLCALACVDWVVVFDEDTPAALIARVLPDVLVKGGDYRVEEIAGADAVLANGGSVQVLDFVDGFSTTALLDRARRTAT